MKTLERVRMPVKSILVIDDERAICEVVKLCLSDLGGWDVFAVNSPLEGLRRASLDRPDAIVVDISMPEMDGFTFLERLRNNPDTQAIPVVLLSAKARWLDPQVLRKYKIAGAIAKPFDATALSARIAAFLGWDFPSLTD
ncbi:response regulator [Kamptonema formosum]|uniref:response regulator n=1 Tax=Kamptonema formosum TaxID=331992 RepID=UPI000346053B|nr:response regulator [Oscillatoria sp. PCC 10802]